LGAVAGAELDHGPADVGPGGRVLITSSSAISLWWAGTGSNRRPCGFSRVQLIRNRPARFV
jgi:hypothetical protein